VGVFIERRRGARRRVLEEARRWASSLEAPVTVFLVGSYARGDFNEWSDVDLVVVSPLFEGVRVLDRLYALTIPPGYEVVPLTPSEFEKLLSRRNPLGVDVACNGVLLRDDLGLKNLLSRAGVKCSVSQGAARAV